MFKLYVLLPPPPPPPAVVGAAADVIVVLLPWTVTVGAGAVVAAWPFSAVIVVLLPWTVTFIELFCADATPITEFVPTNDAANSNNIPTNTYALETIFSRYTPNVLYFHHYLSF